MERYEMTDEQRETNRKAVIKIFRSNVIKFFILGTVTSYSILDGKGAWWSNLLVSLFLTGISMINMFGYGFCYSDDAGVISKRFEERWTGVVSIMVILIMAKLFAM